MSKHIILSEWNVTDDDDVACCYSSDASETPARNACVCVVRMIYVFFKHEKSEEKYLRNVPR